VRFDDAQVAAQRRARLAPFDKKLRQFKVGEALDAALLTRMPEVRTPATVVYPQPL
jgi:hypothetical protein